MAFQPTETHRPSQPVPTASALSEETEWNSLLESAFIAVLEAADEGIIVFDRDGRCRMIGRRAGELFGLEPAAHVGKSRAEVLGLIAQACEEPEVFMQTVGANDLMEPPRIAAEIDLKRPRPRKVLWTTFPVIREGHAWGRLGLVRDVTREKSAERAQKQLQARLDQLLPVDSLTGLPNLRRFREELEREHGRSTRAWDSYAVLRLDVDAMQELNDELGIPVGDSVLEQVAECLNACRREYDILARYEADEFVVLLPGADAVAARAVAERMAKATATHEFMLADERKVSVSVGGCVWVPPSGETGEDIMRRAGAATMQARSSGRGRVHIDGGV
jgi:diguanylate cyclase (GGDEF)-like protein/PAS domain S-box-containing protein